MGRPQKEINQEQFEKLCGLQCTQEEICGFLGVSDKTLTAWIKRTYGKSYSFSDIFKEKRAGGKVSLRRYQFNLAKSNANMAIWLGKQYLGQKDQVEETRTYDTAQFDMIVQATRGKFETE